ncbi:Non-specific serine/threonine protein kinase [Handroanthus impetiginosus]|uniref:Non-specific serine/threonine protein kinase n=1 Tax=Handroanthus impetiginosus TaxID=429701 RepID=A0A2G9FX97_9LAMI|nr:Non-specific serine/threonine protein kinase [Handroanthus impetiginosus]
MFLEGTMSPHIGNLSFLVSLNITGNNFHGDLPENWRINLCRLRVVDFSNSSFGGELPRTWFGIMTDGFEELYLNYSHFSGMVI